MDQRTLTSDFLPVALEAAQGRHKVHGLQRAFCRESSEAGASGLLRLTPPGLDIESLMSSSVASLHAVWTGHPAPGDAPAASTCCCVAGARCRVPGDQGQGFTFAVRTVRPTCFVSKVSGHSASPWRRGRLVTGLVTEQGSRPPRAAQQASHHPQSSVPVVRA